MPLRIVDAWPTLADPVRAGIAAMVEASKTASCTISASTKSQRVRTDLAEHVEALIVQLAILAGGNRGSLGTGL